MFGKETYMICKGIKIKLDILLDTIQFRTICLPVCCQKM
jgi:hypothetical protein